MTAEQDGLGLAAIMDEHDCTYDSRGFEWCPDCWEPWPCPMYRLAVRAKAAEAKVARVETLAARLRSAEATMRERKGATIGRQWHEHEQARLFAEAAAQIERALGDRPSGSAEALADAWDEGHRTPQQREMDDCRCGAWSKNECGCGKYGTGRLITPNPYRGGAS